MSVQTYEQVPYQSKPYAYATADRMAVIGRLFGMEPPDPSRARVLEIGCAGGGNLIPRALVHPDATFYGIDPGEKHVREAQQIIYALGVDNVQVDKRGVESLSAEDGLFDYIVVHGVYSWIPEASRQALLAAIRDRMAPKGMAYVSYNLLPGWHMRQMIRDAMLFHIEPFEDPKEQIEQARAMLGFLASSTPGHTGPWKRLLQSENDMLGEYGDAYVFHDHLSPDNKPVYFRDFVAQIRSFDLDYLGEAQLADMLTVNLDDDVEGVIGKVSGDLIRTQQYLDFLLNRAFRRSILVHAAHEPTQVLSSARMHEVAIESPLRRPKDAAVPLEPGVPVTFHAENGQELTTDATEIKAAWLVLQEAYPSSLAFSDWLEQTADLLGIEVSDELAESLATNGLYAYAQNLVDLWPSAHHLDGHLSPTPTAFPYARLQAMAGARWVTTRRHDGYGLDELDRRVLAYCDGSRTTRQVLDAVLDEARAGDLVVGEGLGDGAGMDAVLAALEEEFTGRLIALGRVGALQPTAECA